MSLPKFNSMKRKLILPAFFLGLATMIILVATQLETKTERNPLKKVRNISFPFVSDSRSKFWGKLEIDSDTYFYFSDATTKKAVVVFRGDSLISTTSLKAVLKYSDRLEGIIPLNLDSFLILSEYSNQLFLINKKGEIINKQSLNDVLKEDDKYELRSSSQGLQIKNRTIYLGNSPKFDSGYVKGNVKALQEAHNKATFRPFLTKFRSIFSITTDYQVENDGVLGRFAVKDADNFDFPNFSFFQDKILVKNIYSDKILLIDTASLKLDKEYSIKPKTVKINCQPLKIEKFDPQGNQDRGNTNVQTCASIRELKWDSYRRLFYLSVIHSVPFDSPPEKKRDNRSWTFIVADENFNILSEKFMKVGEYNYSGFLVTKEGLMLKIHEKNTIYDENKTQFTLFEVIR